MKTLFKEHIAPLTEHEIESIWNNSLFVLDTNVLLSFYGYSEATRNDYFSVLQKHKQSLWLPYQVAWEFFNNRISVISKNHTKWDNLTSYLNNVKSGIEERLKEANDSNDYKKIISNFKDFCTKQQKLISNHKKKEAHYRPNEDKILERIADIFNNKIGDLYTDEELDNIFKDGETRYSAQTPPGYKDTEKENELKKIGITSKKIINLHVYGDLIIWYSLKEKAKEVKKDIVFVTAEKKQDWFLKTPNKDIISPLPELIKEFKETEQNILILRPEEFLYHSKKYDLIPISEQAIRETKNSDTYYNLNLSSTTYIDNLISHQYINQCLNSNDPQDNYNSILLGRIPNIQKILEETEKKRKRDTIESIIKGDIIFNPSIQQDND